MTLLTENTQRTPESDSGQDLENCKGQCGYTRWCRACLEERKQMEINAGRKEDQHVD